ncbi:hypothetical protein GSU69_02795 [Rathayibacter festucae]|uniref:Uncharacterized protein n=1 Tax=Rathayibacter festucae TaxID=110937 RepID=A0ABX6GW95_9MICO|nr:hypothetical protein [Rathayibacter festucae]QHC61728.1 hypothetical protein GSU69_02795 [Rathayibacter festucae]
MPTPLDAPAVLKAVSDGLEGGGLTVGLDVGSYAGIGLTILIALLGSRVLGTWLGGMIENGRLERGFSREDANAAIAALTKLHVAYSKWSAKGRLSTKEEAARDLEVENLAALCLGACALTGVKNLNSASSYRSLGDQWVSLDPDASRDDLDDRYLKLLRALSVHSYRAKARHD